MFDFFRKKAPVEKPAPSLEVEKKTDPLIGPKMGAKQINQSLIKRLKDQRGVHIESFFTVLGALAGFSCQMSVREQMRRRKEGEKIVWAVANGADGKKYYFGDALNKPLAEDQYSVWSLAAGAAQKMGAKVPDVGEIFQHVATTVGGSEFGVPRIPENHRPGDLPVNYLKVMWPSMLPVVTQFCDNPVEWPVLFGLAVQEALFMSKGVIDPGLAVKIVMESAIPMSKVDLPEFYSVPEN